MGNARPDGNYVLKVMGRLTRRFYLATIAADGSAIFSLLCHPPHDNPHRIFRTGPYRRRYWELKILASLAKDTAKKTDEQLLKIIAEGSGKMPASKLSKDEQKQTLGYARSLSK
jgi:hypothetical protein